MNRVTGNCWKDEKMKKMPEMAHLKRNVINYTIWMA